MVQFSQFHIFSLHEYTRWRFEAHFQRESTKILLFSFLQSKYHEELLDEKTNADQLKILIENPYKINSSANKISDDLLETEISHKSHSLIDIKEDSKVLGGPLKRFPFEIFTTNRTVPKWVSFTFTVLLQGKVWTKIYYIYVHIIFVNEFI